MIHLNQVPDPAHALSFGDVSDDVCTHIAQHIRLPDFMKFMNITSATRTYFRGKGAESVWRCYLPVSCQRALQGKKYEEWPSEYQELVPPWYRDNHCPIQGLVRKIADTVTEVLARAWRPGFDPCALYDTHGEPVQYLIWTLTDLHLEPQAPHPCGFRTYADENGAVRSDRIEAYRLFTYIVESKPGSLRYVFSKADQLSPSEWLVIEEALCEGSMFLLDRECAIQVANAIQNVPGVPQSFWLRILEHYPGLIVFYQHASLDCILGVLKAHLKTNAQFEDEATFDRIVEMASDNLPIWDTEYD